MTTLQRHQEDTSAAPRRTSPALWVALLLGGLFAFAGLVSLGLWQMNRLTWKTELIERIEQRQKAEPVAAPGPADWEALNAVNAEYRRVLVRGTFAHDLETQVQATTALGSGYWVLTPLRTEEGYWVIVNRGFVPPDKRERAQRGPAEPTGTQAVSGLLRISEPTGRMLQKNDPAAGRWYSRDVAAIAAARGLGSGERAGAVAPYFVDVAAKNDAPLDWPRPGLTVLHFSNSHLMYALTWFALAAMTAAALIYAMALEHRAQQRRAAQQPA